jgi:hypothetical protein
MDFSFMEPGKRLFNEFDTADIVRGRNFSSLEPCREWQVRQGHVNQR